ncbi:MAG: hypothetical protein WCP85_19360 [Mariniphaga sp.]
METITTSLELRNAIQRLEIEQANSSQLLKEQLYFVKENIKPVNLVKNAISEVVKSPLLINHVIESVLLLASGYFSGKIVLGAAGQIIRSLLSPIVQSGIENISRKTGMIKSLGKYLIQQIFHKRKKELEDHEQ